MTTSWIQNPQLITDYKQYVRDSEVTGVCGRTFIRTERLKKWMEPHKSDLLTQAYRGQNPWETPKINQIWNETDEAWLVFALLLELDRGDLIHLFLRHNFRNLPIRQGQEELCKTLIHYADIPQLDPQDCESIVKHIDRRQYAFCPVRFKLRHDQYCIDRQIVPIHYKEKINTKGVTANVWQVEILEEFLESDLREVLKRARYFSDDVPDGPVSSSPSLICAH